MKCLCKVLILGSLLGATLFTAVPAAAESTPAITVKRLAGDGEFEVRLESVIQAPRAAVESVLGAYHQYSEILPALTKSDIFHEGEDGTLVNHELNLPWPVPNMKTRTFFQNSTVVGGGRQIRWSTVQNTAGSAQGEYLLLEMADQTRLVQVVRIQLSPKIPRWVLEWGTRSVLPDYVRRIEARAKSLSHTHARADI